MTKPITHSRVLKIAIPIVLSNATVPILGAVDTGVVGQMGLAAPIGAVGIGAIIITAIYWIFGFLRMGTSGLTAQAIGAEDRAETCALLTRALIIGFGAGFFFICIQIPLFWAAFKVAPASDEVESLAQTYLQIRIFSAPAAIALFGITGWLIAAERTTGVLVLQLWMNGVNIILDLVFVLGFDWGVEGVAFATVIAEWSGLALGLWLARDGFKGGHWNNWPSVFNRVRLTNMLAVNTDIMIRSILLEAIFVSFLFLGSSFDDVTLAANQICLQFLHITAFALDGFAFGAEALVGQAMGRRNRAQLRESAIISCLWGGITVALLALVFYVLGPNIIALMTTATDVQAEALRYLPWMIAAPLIGCPAWMFDGIFIGATRTRDMRNMMILSTVVYFAAVFVLLEPYGNHGLWACLLISFIARGVTLGWKYPSLEAGTEVPTAKPV